VRADFGKRRLTDEEVAQRRKLRLEAMNLQEIAGNPLDADDIAMFEMFERERWTEEECLAYILARARELASKQR
jgi:hypothetical protein